jgi:trans-aconitate 2-methyltransferase
MSDWNPALYRRFETERTRPARDLLAQVPLETARTVVDLGCGPGNSTELLAQRFPDADILGVDTSAAMLEQARARLPNCRFAQADAASWTPESPPDLIYANAALQWVPNHETLFPRLLGFLAPSGVLAVQMPDNREEPSHRLMRETAAVGPWAAKLAQAGERVRMLAPVTYYDLLAGRGADTEIWRTLFHHRMDSVRAIVDWVRSTGLQPFLTPLDYAERAEFLAQYEGALETEYLPRAEGKYLLLFPRFFLIAQKISSPAVGIGLG